MKKRAKLFTTIASLCMAVALMAFGVYAATTATFTVTSSVNFVAENIKVTAKVVKVDPTNTWAVPEFTAAEELVAGTPKPLTYTGNLTEAKKICGFAIEITNGYTAAQTINLAYSDVSTHEGADYTYTTQTPATVAAGKKAVAFIYVTVDDANIATGTEIALNMTITASLA